MTHFDRTLDRIGRHGTGERAIAAPSRDARDPRWYSLDLIRRARHELGLRDRDVAILRGLLSLLPASDWGGPMIVFASNRVLSARCDGIEERTLRRRLCHLEARGLLERRMSPNGKRYQIRDEAGDALLTYGIDLAPLHARLAAFEALATRCDEVSRRCKAVRSLIRHRLFEIARDGLQVDAAAILSANRGLRRKLAPVELEALLAALECDATDRAVPAPVMSGSDGQNVRQIQSSNKEDLDLGNEATENVEINPRPRPPIPRQTRNPDLTISDCMNAATAASSLALKRPDSWSDIVELAQSLSPGIGIGSSCLRLAQAALGPIGAALAVLGLVEAYPRIRKPSAYLNALIARARRAEVDPVRMFNSLTRPGKRSEWKLEAGIPG